MTERRTDRQNQKTVSRRRIGKSNEMLNLYLSVKILLFYPC